MLHPIRAVAVVTALGLAAGAAIWTVQGHDAPPHSAPLGRIAPIALTTASDCTALLRYYQREATSMVGPFGLNGGQIYPLGEAMGDTRVRMMSVPGASGASIAGTDSTATGSAGAGSAPNASAAPDTSTNVQVAGVDEGDVVKTSGDLMVSVLAGEVRITRLAGRRTSTLATWRPASGFAQSVLLDGNTAVIIGAAGALIRPALATAAVIPSEPSPLTDSIGPRSDAGTELTVLDLSDPTRPRPIRRLEISGNRSGEARLADGELRLAVTAGPNGLRWDQPAYPRMLTRAIQRQAEKHSTAANLKVIAASKIGNWLPEATLTPLTASGKPAGPAQRRPLLDCNQVAIPGTFSGLETLAMVSVDLRAEAPLSSWRAAGAIAAGSTLYATADHAWLATAQWAANPALNGKAGATLMASPRTTQIHLFDTPVRAQPRYLASGQVAGTLLNQFAMDERDGMLRVASTTETEAGPMVTGNAASSSAPIQAPGPIQATAGRISVLRVNGDRLTRVGEVAGLGMGELIRGVRFAADVAYVVTYRQTDPLFTVDLSDPAHPRLRGELKLLGYSAYLHPTGPGRLLGLGQDGTQSGQPTGLQLSLFDVTDLNAPRRLDRIRIVDAWSDAESDHHAFTLAGNLALIPYSSSRTAANQPVGAERSVFDAGVIAVRVTSERIGTSSILRPLARGPVSFDPTRAANPIQRLTDATPIRTSVHDGVIYTLTPLGVAVHDANTFTRLTFASF